MFQTTPYPELPWVLGALVAGVRAELADNLVGVYLVGSLATGDFDCDSDISFLQYARDEGNGDLRPVRMGKAQGARAVRYLQEPDHLIRTLEQTIPTILVQHAVPGLAIALAQHGTIIHLASAAQNRC